MKSLRFHCSPFVCGVMRPLIPLPSHRGYSLLLGLLIASSALAEDIGPFSWTTKLYDPANPQPTAIGFNGLLESVTLPSGDADSGEVVAVQWQGTNQAGSRSFSANNLAAPPGSNYFLTIQDWSIQQGFVDAAGQTVYVDKVQQDARFYLGWADVPGSALPTDHGAGFEFHGAVPWSRLILALPFRRVIGGKATWNTDDRNGVPVHAGLFAVAAGQTLSQAQANDANQLLDLKAFLAEVPPDTYQTGFCFAVGANGEWTIAADIGNDGQIDRAFTAQDGSPNPYPSITGQSGLLVTAEPAGGNPTGTIGRSVMELQYRRHDQELPTNIDRRPLVVPATVDSLTSPATLEGKRWGPSFTVSATSGSGQELPVSYLGSRSLLVSVDMEPVGSSVVDWAQSGLPATQASTAVRWIELPTTATQEVTILAGSSLLFRSQGSGSYRVEHESGLFQSDLPRADDELIVISFPETGLFTTLFHDSAGNLIGSYEIDVVAIDFPDVIPCQFKYQRNVTLAVAPELHNRLFWTAADPEDLDVTVHDETIGVTVLRVRPLKMGAPHIVARLDGSSGPIIGCKAVTPYAITDNMAGGYVYHLDKEGVGHMTYTMTMTPRIPGQTITLDFFGSGASINGQSITTFSSTELLPDGTWSAPLDIVNGSATCHRITVRDGPD